MARQSRALGRGLVALIDPTAPVAAGGAIDQLPVGAIEPNARQPRLHWESDALDELTRSIRADGVLQPILVRAIGAGRYELIAGERRWRAARAAGLATIPAVVRDTDDRDRLILALVENVVRENLNAIEVARGYAALVDELGLSAAEIAERVGRSRTAVANGLRLLELPDEVIDAIADGRLSEGHGRAILMADGQEARRILGRRAIADGLSVRALEELARSGRTAARRRRAAAQPDWFDEALADDAIDSCYRAFELPTRVRTSGTGVRLEIVARDAAELARLVDRLAGVASLADSNLLP